MYLIDTDHYGNSKQCLLSPGVYLIRSQFDLRPFKLVVSPALSRHAHGEMVCDEESMGV